MDNMLQGMLVGNLMGYWNRCLAVANCSWL